MNTRSRDVLTSSHSDLLTITNVGKWYNLDRGTSMYKLLVHIAVQ